MEEQQKPVKAHKLVVNNRKTSMVTGKETGRKLLDKDVQVRQKEDVKHKK